jgi:hypothetical protein
MRPYDSTLTKVAENEFYAKNVQYEVSGHIAGDIRDQLQDIADQLCNGLKGWVFASGTEAYDYLNHVLDYILEGQFTQCRSIISEHVSFTIVF